MIRISSLATIHKKKDTLLGTLIHQMLCQGKETKGAFNKELFFLISNENIIKKRKTANSSTLGMYYGGINQ